MWCVPMGGFLLTPADVCIFLPFSRSDSVQLCFRLKLRELTAGPPKGQILPRRLALLFLSAPPACRQVSLCHPHPITISVSPTTVRPLVTPTKPSQVPDPPHPTPISSDDWLCSLIAQHSFLGRAFPSCSIISRVLFRGASGSTALFVRARRCFSQQVSQRNWNESSFWLCPLTGNLWF